MIQVFKDPDSDAIALVYDEGESGIYEIPSDGYIDLVERDTVPRHWTELTP